LAEDLSTQQQMTQTSLLNLNPQVDSKAIQLQQSLLDETKKAASELATKGFIDSGRRRNLHALKQQYTTEIVPLKQALEQRNQRAEEYRKLAMDKTNILGRNPNEVSLYDIKTDPTNLDYKFLSGSQMAKDVENVAKQYADQLLSPNNVNKIKHLAAYQDLINIKMGADPSLVLNAMKNNPNTYKDSASRQIYEQLIGTVNSVADRYGLKDVASTPEEYNRGWQIAASGLSSAIGKSQQQVLHDTYAQGLQERRNAVRDSQQNPEPPGKTDKKYDAAFDEKNFAEINKLVNNAAFKEGKSSQATGRGTNMYLASVGAPNLKFDEKFVPTMNSANDAQRELFKRAKALGKDLGFTLPDKVAKKDLPALNNRIAEALKDQYRTANLSRHYFNPSGETTQKFASALSSLDEITDVNGKEISRDKIFSNGKLIGDSYLIRGKNGTTLKTIDKDGKSVSIPFDISKLGSTRLRDYDAQIQQIKSDMNTMSKKRLQEYYGDPEMHIQKYEDAIDDILTSEQYTETKSQDTNPGYSGQKNITNTNGRR